jgi:hypothetical protein
MRDGEVLCPYCNMRVYGRHYSHGRAGLAGPISGCPALGSLRELSEGGNALL